MIFNRSTGLCVGFFLAVFGPAQVRADLTIGDLYGTAESLNQVIQINRDGSWNTALRVLENPWGLAFRSPNDLYVTGTGPNWPTGNGAYLVDYRPDGTAVFTDNIPVTNRWPNGSEGSGIAIDSQGNAYVATWNSPGATKISADNQVSDWTGYQYGLWWGRYAALSPKGQLYMIQGLDYGSNPTSTVATINKVGGAVDYLFQNVPWLNGLAIDRQGNLYLSEYTQNEIVRIAAGSDTITPFASLTGASSLTIGPDGKLYAFSAGSTNQIWSFDLNNGQRSLYASDLPYLQDIAFDTDTISTPEPSTLLTAWLGAIAFIAYGRSRSRRIAH